MDISVILAAVSFPAWLRITHFINILFIGLLMRSGIQILAAHPRLYWNIACKPGSEWLRFTKKKVPRDKLWTSMDEEVKASPLLALPGGENLGLGRHWHFFSVTFWLLNGLIYVILLFATGEWSRLIPTSWDIIPRAIHTMGTYLTFHIPPKGDFQPYDPLQQLAYAAIVFLVAPLSLLTGAAMSPAIEGRFPWYPRLFGNRQVARSLHFIMLVIFVLFTIVHTLLVLVVYFDDNIRHIVLGTTQSSLGLAIAIAVVALAFVLLFYAWASWFTLRHKRGVQHTLGHFVDRLQKLFLRRVTSAQDYSRADLTPYFWVNGRPPDTEEYKQLLEEGFKDWRLEVKGMVANPMHFSLDDLKRMPVTKQRTLHNCIQGWTGVAEWKGVCVSEILATCGALPDVKYLVFTSLEEDSMGRPYYEVIDIELACHPQTILAYEMNGKPLPIPHGAPLRLRVETTLGFKMVKYLRSIELVQSYRPFGNGQGGYREDVRYYGIDAEI
ncbi:DMSO/TMAO reductase YedYZ molybdopterin-dependent catalytic subunit [Thermosporothrix hazakensis]|jgi:DMSO/TMAO reductase YedYZ molybdopterin-dependent catalytic subunit/thiosulfate reductase cytochrome b subunit|uniref:DMSO/TMAO reductase YedYZ molybdopterin-dependent catalytic subunit n=2 Tax=Thermosporothrix TaxID=768650 RepID=A0A326UF21_THEHA|nr:molybdopterin-dependent oxidoreductase [Thermosporothrix hazakensis]PZW36471.1 DMSO/TMAO reductase YedYZ molybdopterin-dependent catalytic subunit [Thermosporothrix hazakensis]BBH88940.1 hypothetical protein KTC_36910 [Thermosporothrix sp. COM3]GCE47126.1 hypothetical protein KTH_19950 [Thermosporothrix hazakensis]